MATSKDLDREKRIKKEFARLKKLLAAIPPERLNAAEGIMRRAAFMQVTLEDLEADMNKKGTTEVFSQTPGIAYDRERPAARIYNTMIKNYSAACKQLLDLLPEPDRGADETDELMEFVKRRTANRYSAKTS